MIVRELNLIACAFQFLTRIPTPHLRDFQPEWIQASARYYPLVGMVVGAVSAALMVGASHLWSPWIAALIAVGACMALTGCFHEDGLADTADGIGGGQTRDRRLEIMKDSRLGTYGAAVLFMNLLLRVACLAGLIAFSPMVAGICLIAANSMGRSVAVLAMAAMPYGGHPGMAKEGKPDRATWINAVIALAIGAPPLMLLNITTVGISLAAGFVVAGIPALLAWRLLGGRTGDVLGAVEQAFEIGFLLAASAVLLR